MSANLLVELLTEELPPKALRQLAEAFGKGIADGLATRGLVAADAARVVYATPRRLAVKIDNVLERGADRSETKKLMPSKVAFGADGKASAALLKRLEKEGYPADVEIDGIIERKMDGKEEFAFQTRVVAGQPLAVALQSSLEDAMQKLPIPKIMSYQLADGTTTVHFVRPAHGLVALHGKEIVPVAVLGLNAGRSTHGHRFQGVREIEIAHADAYEEALAAHGGVIAGFAGRRAEILAQLEKQAAGLGATLGAAADYEPLLDEVTALVELPTAYTGAFEAEYLTVPQECLVLTMRANQKYFPLFDAAGKLTNRFLIVSNMRLADPKNIVEGNQRVIRPRLADARFFFETDKKVRLEERVPELAKIVYHNKLGSQLERTTRVQTLAGYIARAIGADPALAERAAWLAKADLPTNMVGEFPELQGTMGRYYALADGESAVVANAIGNQYRTRFGEDAAADSVAASLYLADRIETLVGIWGIGLQPTGDKDPFGLRRAALGVISVFEWLGAQSGAGKFDLLLGALIDHATAQFKAGVLGKDITAPLIDFVFERCRNQLATRHDRNAVDAVIALQPPLQEVAARLHAVVAFSAMPEAAALAAANKRIGNILKKAEAGTSGIDRGLFAEPAEHALCDVLEKVRPAAAASFAAGDYSGSLMQLAQTRDAVDAFFNDVMVMADDPRQRDNRIALLRELHGLMNNVADISRLAA
jgi:glycyl-tRNA synthetase beta chain